MLIFCYKIKGGFATFGGFYSKLMQITNTILMIRPVAFRMNEQTAVNNYFQETLKITNEEINKKAQKEFDTFVEVLRGHGVEVIVVDDTKERDTPDSIFPNNWVSFHATGTVAVYPMFAKNRRRKKKQFELVILNPPSKNKASEDRFKKLYQIKIKFSS